jgi:hypothetical protein
MNLLTSLYSIFQDEDSLGQEEVEVVGLEEDLDALGLEDTSDSRGHNYEEEEGHDEREEGHEEGEEGHDNSAGLYDKGVGVWVYFRIRILTPI